MPFTKALPRRASNAPIMKIHRRIPQRITLDRKQLLALMELLHAKDKIAALRDRSSFTFMLSSVGRGNDSRLVSLSDMLTPQGIGCIGDIISSPPCLANLHILITSVALNATCQIMLVKLADLCCVSSAHCLQACSCH